MAFRKKSKSKPVVGARRRRESSSGSGQRGDHWYEVVRSLRTFYDHFQVAFPHLENLPKHYSKEWAEQFKKVARDFVRTEDMHGVRKVLVGAGYGTEKWPEVVKHEVEDIARAVDILLEEVAGKGVETEGGLEVDVDPAILNAKGVIGDELWEAMLDMPQLVIPILKRHLLGEPEDQVASETGSPNDRLAEQLAELEAELESWKQKFEESKKENHALVGQVEEKDREIQVLEGRIRRTEDAEEEVAPAFQAKAVEEPVSERQAELEAELDTVQRRYDELKQEHKDLQGDAGEKDAEIRTLNEDLKKALATLQKDGRAEQETQQKFESPSSMGGQLRELEQKLKANEMMISGLRNEVEQKDQTIEEFKDDLGRERERRRKFEEELEQERENLREQMQRLKAVMAGNEELPSMEEFEQMEAEELLDYIEDVEKEKQRALAGLEALDAQEESYQKQLEVQEEELGTIQEDLDNYKETALATEVEGARDTILTQREQLETLLNFSKNLKAQVAHLKERQEPLRSLVERSNLQEKALVRYVRMNFDRNFLPSQAYSGE
ncbi:MAG: hypothetical protein O7G87_13400 [bacterium]|nr:hypothetical protein [bacterium]